VSHAVIVIAKPTIRSERSHAPLHDVALIAFFTENFSNRCKLLLWSKRGTPSCCRSRGTKSV
jgi:hypothetical protein